MRLAQVISTDEILTLWVGDTFLRFQRLSNGAAVFTIGGREHAVVRGVPREAAREWVAGVAKRMEAKL